MKNVLLGLVLLLGNQAFANVKHRIYSCSINIQNEREVIFSDYISATRFELREYSRNVVSSISNRTLSDGSKIVYSYLILKPGNDGKAMILISGTKDDEEVNLYINGAGFDRKVVVRKNGETIAINLLCANGRI